MPLHSPRGDEEWMESHLELWSGTPGASDLLPGYGWIFPMGDGIVNVGLGSVASRAGATNLPYREVFKTWTANLPEEWGFTPENQIGQLRSAAARVPAGVALGEPSALPRPRHAAREQRVPPRIEPVAERAPKQQEQPSKQARP